MAAVLRHSIRRYLLHSAHVQPVLVFHLCCHFFQVHTATRDAVPAFQAWIACESFHLTVKGNAPVLMTLVLFLRCLAWYLTLRLKWSLLTPHPQYWILHAYNAVFCVQLPKTDLDSKSLEFRDNHIRDLDMQNSYRAQTVWILRHLGKHSRHQH